MSVTPYGRVLEPLSRFVSGGGDASRPGRRSAAPTREYWERACAETATLLRDGGRWRARVGAGPGDGDHRMDVRTAPEKTALGRDVAYRMALALAEAIDNHFRTPQARVKQALRRVVGMATPTVMSHACSRSRLQSVRRRQPLVREPRVCVGTPRICLGGAARTAQSPGASLAQSHRTAHPRQQCTNESADRAMSRVTDQTPRTDVLFARAVSAEARRDFAAAEEVYHALVRESRDPVWSMELGGFLDRRDRNADAVVAYHQALESDPHIVRARLELCRLYSPSRLNEPVEATKYGEAALAAYRSLAAGPDGPHPSGGEGQSLMCLADTLRVGGSADRRAGATACRDGAGRLRRSRV